MAIYNYKILTLNQVWAPCIGKQLKAKYSELMDGITINKVRIRTSDKKRTILSALWEVLGIFGSNEWIHEMDLFVNSNSVLKISSSEEIPFKLNEWLFNYSQYIQVIKDSDYKYYTTEWNCPMFKELYNDYIKDEEMQLSDIKNKIDLWTDKHYPIDRNQTYDFWDTIENLTKHDVKLNSTVFGNSTDIFSYCSEYTSQRRREIISRNPLASKLYSNELLKDILYAIQSASKDSPALYIDLCHGHNQFAILNELVSSSPSDTMGNEIVFELHSGYSGVSVRLFSDSQLLLSLPLSAFKSLMLSTHNFHHESGLLTTVECFHYIGTILIIN